MRPLRMVATITAVSSRFAISTTSLPPRAGGVEPLAQVAVVSHAARLERATGPVGLIEERRATQASLNGRRAVVLLLVHCSSWDRDVRAHSAPRARRNGADPLARVSQRARPGKPRALHFDSKVPAAV